MDDLNCAQCPYRGTLYCKTYCGYSPDFRADEHLAFDSLDKGRKSTPIERCIGCGMDILGEPEAEAKANCERLRKDPVIKETFGSGSSQLVAKILKDDYEQLHPSTDEMITRSQDLIKRYRQMEEEKERQVKTASEPYMRSRAERELEIKKLVVIQGTKLMKEQSEKQETDKKLQLILENKRLNDEMEKAHPDWPKYEPEKRTRTDQFGKPVQPSTVGSLFGKSKSRKEDAQK